MCKSGFLLPLIASCLVISPAAYSQYEYGGYARAPKQYPQVAASASGEFVVVWADMDHVYAQRYGSSGNRMKEEIRVDKDIPTRNLEPPDVRCHRASMDRDGNFVVAWESSGEFQEIHVRFFDREGNVTAEFTDRDKLRPVVSMSPSGGFALAYHDLAEGRTFVRLFSPEGKPVSDALHVSGRRARAWGLDVDMNASGDLVVTCEETRRVGGIHVSAFERMNPAFHTAISRAGVQDPSVAMDAHGSIAIVWEEKTADAAQLGFTINNVMLSVLDRKGQSDFDAEPVRVNRQHLTEDADPDVIFDENGDVVVVYSARKRGKHQIFSNRYSLSRNSSSTALWISDGEFSNFENRNPSVANLPNGSYVVVWETYRFNDDGKFDSLRPIRVVRPEGLAVRSAAGRRP